jgi:ATP-dependent DNA helicase RecQ
MMQRYADHTGCRRSFLLSYFGQDYPGQCGNCDNDSGSGAVGAASSASSLASASASAVPFPVGTRVVSERWGTGSVQRYDGDHVTVLFDEHGYRELYVPAVLDRGLLRSA